MIDFSPIHGNAYAGDPDYDTMTGRVTYRHEVVGMTLDGWKVRHIVEVIDLGRPAAIDARDPDAAMRRERLDMHDDARMAAAQEGLQSAKAQRFRQLREVVKAYLAEHGPMSAYAIADGLGSGAFARVLDMLRRSPEHFVYIGGQFKVWGLPGQPYTPPKTKPVSKTMLALRAALEAHGPQTSRELAERLRIHQATAHKSLLAKADWFRVVEVREGCGNVPPTRVWGLQS